MKVQIFTYDRIEMFDNVVSIVYWPICQYCNVEFPTDKPTDRFCKESHRVMHSQKHSPKKDVT